MSCATSDYYSPPPNLTNYAIIDDDTHWENSLEDGLGASKTAIIISVDRVTVAYKRNLITPDMSINMTDLKGINFGRAIPLSPGEHKLLIEVCESGNRLWHLIWYSDKCVRTVIRLRAEPHGRYRVAGSVSMRKNHADVWIENLKDGTLAVDKVRIKGLRTK